MEWMEGQLVRSKQGRDKGKFYLILRVEEDFCLLTDGDKKPVAAPKRKNKKHIEGTYGYAGSVREKLMTGVVPDDVEIKRFIKCNQTETRVTEGDQCPSKMQSKWKALS